MENGQLFQNKNSCVSEMLPPFHVSLHKNGKGYVQTMFIVCGEYRKSYSCNIIAPNTKQINM